MKLRKSLITIILEKVVLKCKKKAFQFNGHQTVEHDLEKHV